MDMPKPIYSSNFFKVGSIIIKYLLLCKMVTMGTLQQSFRPRNKASQEYIVWGFHAYISIENMKY